MQESQPLRLPVPGPHGVPSLTAQLVDALVQQVAVAGRRTPQWARERGGWVGCG
jgi:hypothetical protein